MKKWAMLPPVRKNFYKEHQEVTEMPAAKVAFIREKNNNITVDRLFMDQPLAEVPIPNPIERFEQCFSEYPDLMGESSFIVCKCNALSIVIIKQN